MSGGQLKLNTVLVKNQSTNYSFKFSTISLYKIWNEIKTKTSTQQSYIHSLETKQRDLKEKHFLHITTFSFGDGKETEN